MRNNQYKDYTLEVLTNLYPNEDPEKLWQTYLEMQDGFKEWDENRYYGNEDNGLEDYADRRGE